MKISSVSVVNFYKFADANPVQTDYGLGANNWMVDEERKHLDKNFLKAIKYFDEKIRIPKAVNDPISTEELLHIYDSLEYTGPELTFPDVAKSFAVQEKTTTPSFTIEFWLLIDQFITGNFSIIGMSDRGWDQGFSIGGYMTSTDATIACILDTPLISTMKPPCYARTQLCLTLETPDVWKHISCVRQGSELSRIAIDDDVKNVSLASDPLPKADIETLFGSANFVIGKKLNNTAGFAGYLRELRFWTRYFTEMEIDSMGHEALLPHVHTDLIGYWPLINGGRNTFIEVSDYTIQDVSSQTSNSKSFKAFAERGHSWSQAPKLWNLAICPKGYTYRPLSNSCIANANHVFLYFGGKTETNSKQFDLNAQLPTSPDVSISMWVYHTKKPDAPVILLFLNDFVDFQYNPYETVFKLSGRQGSKEDLKSIYYFSQDLTPIFNHWVHYAMTVNTIEPKENANPAKGMYFYYDQKYEVTDFEDAGFCTEKYFPAEIGTNLDGFIRELKVWNAFLGDADIKQEKYLYFFN